MNTLPAGLSRGTSQKPPATTSTTMIRTFKYRLDAPLANSDLIDVQMRLAHEYQNKLVEIELARRAAVRQLLGTDPEVDSLSRQIEAVAGGELTKAIRAQLKEMRTTLKARKRAVALQSKPALEAITLKSRDDARAARGEFAARGLYWGSYLVVEQAMDLARSGKMDPRFRRWTGEGAVAVQFQQGLAVTAFEGTDTRIQLDPRLQPSRAPKALADGSERERAFEKLRPRLRMRIGSDGRAPVWAEWGIEYPVHGVARRVRSEPLPETGMLRWAKVVRRKVASKYHWFLLLTCEVETVVSSLDGVCAIDIGWRQIGDDVRVAVWRDAHGQGGELRVPQEIRDMFVRCEQIRSERDKLLDVLRPKAVEYFREHPREDAETIHAWRSPARFAALTWRVREEPIYTEMEEWRRTDKRLWEEEANLRRKALDKRMDLYRQFARQLAETYQTVVLERFDLRPMVRLDSDQTSDAQVIRGNRFEAALSELRSKVEWAFKMRGGAAVKVDAKNTTQACHACQHLNDFDAAKAIDHKCTSCGVTWDQDVNAAYNLLTRYDGRPTEEAPVPARASRSDRLKASKKGGTAE